MLRRDFEVFFLGTAIFVTHDRKTVIGPQVIKQKPRRRQPRSVSVLLFYQLRQLGEWTRRGTPIRHQLAGDNGFPARVLRNLGAGGAREGRQGERELLRHGYADIDRLAVEHLAILLLGVKLNREFGGPGLPPREQARAVGHSAGERLEGDPAELHDIGGYLRGETNLAPLARQLDGCREAVERDESEAPRQRGPLLGGRRQPVERGGPPETGR